MELHPAVAHLAPLVGTWRGGGAGHYPTIDPFEYTEEVTFGHVGKPFLAYTQRTKSIDGAPMHAESGYWRPTGEQGLEVLIVHPSGIVEVLVGEATETHFGLLVTLTAGASEASGDGGTSGASGRASDGETSSDSAGPTGTSGSDSGSDSGSGGAPEVAAGAGDAPTPDVDGAHTAAAGRVVLAPTAKRVDATERRFSVDGDTLRYEVNMAAVGLTMTPHLEATLHRAT